MKIFFSGFSLMLAVSLLIGFPQTEAKVVEDETPDTEQHNWEEYSTHYETVGAGTHEFTYWKNFIERTRTCDISHKLKSVVYYCDVHDHTDSEIFLEETLHSESHQ